MESMDREEWSWNRMEPDLDKLQYYKEGSWDDNNRKIGPR